MRTKSSNLFAPATSRNREAADTLRAMALDKERGARIRELRNAHGYVQQEVADRVGVTLRGYQFWEEGKSPPAGDNLKRLARVLDVDPLYITRGEAAAPDLMGQMGGDALARLERIETAINQLRDDHALILACVDQLQAVVEQLVAAGVLEAIAVASASEAISDAESEAPAANATPPPERNKHRRTAA